MTDLLEAGLQHSQFQIEIGQYQCQILRQMLQVVLSQRKKSVHFFEDPQLLAFCLF
jgi:hypothetical protein